MLKLHQQTLELSMGLWDIFCLKHVETGSRGKSQHDGGDRRDTFKHSHGSLIDPDDPLLSSKMDTL